MPWGSISFSISSLVSALPWSQILADLWELGRYAMSRLIRRGMYQVLELNLAEGAGIAEGSLQSIPAVP